MNYRTKKERLENAKKMKRGGCIELIRSIEDLNPADLGMSEDYDALSPAELRDLTVGELLLNVGGLYFKQANHTEAMRDMNDVKAVMTERNLIGTVIPIRVYKPITRAMQQVAGFVTPKQVIGENGEEAAPNKSKPSDVEEPPEL